MRSSFLQSPEFLSLPSFGLSISQDSIRLAKLKHTRVGRIPQAIDEVALTQPCDFFSNPNSMSDCSELKQKLVDLRKKYKIKFVQLGIPEENTYVFRLLIPNTTLELIEEFIINNIDQYVPLTAAEVYFDYKILKEHLNDTNIPVVVTAIPKIVIEKYVSLLESCGILTVACEPDTHAIARSVIDRGDLNPYIILNVSQYSTNISVVEEGLVQYTQTLPVRTQDLAKAIAPEIANTIKDSINKVIVYWFTSKEQQVRGSKIENLIMTGEGVDSPELVNFLETSLSVNAKFGNVWKNCFDLKDYVPKISKTDSLKYATCIGLSMNNPK